MKGTYKHTKASMKHFYDHRCLYQSEESKCIWTHGKDGDKWQFRINATRIDARQEERRSGEDGGKIELKLSEDNTRAVSRGDDKLIGEFKMVAGDVVSIRG